MKALCFKLYLGGTFQSGVNESAILGGDNGGGWPGWMFGVNGGTQFGYWFLLVEFISHPSEKSSHIGSLHFRNEWFSFLHIQASSLETAYHFSPSR